MRKRDLEKIFIKHVDVGACVINIPLVIKLWESRWAILQWHEKYTFTDGKYVKAHISKVQALKIITSLKLVAIHCDIFNHALTWRTLSATVEIMCKCVENEVQKK